MKDTARRLGADIRFKFHEGGLHSTPDKLHTRLQEAIDDIDRTHASPGPHDRIIIGYGVCGKGTIGIQSRNIPLVIPRVHDCIALFLGGDDAYKREFDKYPGTYYLSAGWCEENTEPVSQRNQVAYYGEHRLHYDDLVEKHGETAANHTFDFLNSWQKNYQRAAFIETGAKSSGKFEKKAKEMASTYGWKYDKILGSQALIEKLITAEASTTEILVVPKGHVIGFDAIQSTLSARPILDKGKIADTDEHDLIKDADSALGLDESPPQREDTAFIKFGLGVDAGGTYTDAVIYDLESNQTCCKGKSLTTKWDFTVGISNALKKLSREQLKQVELVSLSTTLATNAIVENDGQKVGTILMPPYGLDMTRDFSFSPIRIVQGQLDISGRQVCDIDPEEIKEVAEHMVSHHGVTAFAVSGFAGSINPDHEIRIKDILSTHTGLFVTCGHELSDSLNFKTRATTAVLNARIVPRLATLLLDLEKTMADFGIHAPIVVVKGDGTLMSAGIAKQRPVETILSGPAASVAGARHLTGKSDAMVVDMGGTTTDTAALADNQVTLNDQGSYVGGHRTHVKALDIRTTGLGGDSQIQFNKGEFHMGPRRVVPVSWLGAMFEGTALAIRYLSDNIHRFKTSSRRMQLIAMTGSKKTFDLTPKEEKVLSLIESRPYSLEELVDATDALSESGVPLERLEENFIIQRCGFTLTDLLHITGEFVQWDMTAANEMLRLLSVISGTDPKDLVQQLIDQGISRLTLELLKRQMADQVNPDHLDDCPTCQYFLNHLKDNTSKHFNISFNLKRPVIGIGAPIKYFLPRAAAPLNAETILPVDADVANAIGAITSKVVIRRQIRIVPGEQGGFLIEGITGTRRFNDFDEANAFATAHITRAVKNQAVQSGTSSTDVRIQTRDRIPTTAGGDPVFVERIISASLTGRPDRVAQAALI
ncbi:MAG: DUF1638 domain-containing protein [Desulfobacteraceae bacterium]|nr:MAG: DUF1638 domain-containing protein [Desulfobacteraceae bacterium]